MTFNELCTSLNVTADEQQAMAEHLAALRAKATIRDHAPKPALQRIAELLEDGEGPDLNDLLRVSTKHPWLNDEERRHLGVIVHWAHVSGVSPTPATQSKWGGRRTLPKLRLRLLVPRKGEVLPLDGTTARRPWRAGRAGAAMKRPSDAELLDFLADKGQDVAAVLLPEECVYRHLDSMRDAIWDAMRMHQAKQAANDAGGMDSSPAPLTDADLADCGLLSELFPDDADGVSSPTDDEILAAAERHQLYCWGVYAGGQRFVNQTGRAVLALVREFGAGNAGVRGVPPCES
ncbi:hypothetical protein [Ramlibacter sp.]|uniref:hypothetical protein n=1 Tax=Ramlibacter sp. TaxID=1917967 RepID=UPI003D0F54E7